MFGVGDRWGKWCGAAAAVCAAVALAGVTACGSGGGGDNGGDNGGDGGGKGAGKSPAPSRSALPAGASEARLEAAAFTDGEAVGTYTASEYTLDGPLNDMYTATPAVCGPFVSLAADTADHAPTAQVQRKVDVPEDMLGVTVDVTLRAYGDGEAAKVMESLDRAGKDCAEGFTEERVLVNAKYLKAEPVTPPDLAGADEAKAYRFTVLDVKGKQKLYEYLTVVRSGSTTLAFRAEIIGTSDFGGVPQDIMAAQWEKFRAART